MLDLGDLSAWDLLSTFSRLMRETLANQPLSVVGDPRPMRFYVTNLARAMRIGGRMTLGELLLAVDEKPSRETLVGGFCALLELIRLDIVTVEQRERAGEIEIRLARNAAEDVDELLDGAVFEDELAAAAAAAETEAEEAEPGEESAEEPGPEAPAEPDPELAVQPAAREAGKSPPTP
jgi:hypothetical protein